MRRKSRDQKSKAKQITQGKCKGKCKRWGRAENDAKGKSHWKQWGEKKSISKQRGNAKSHV